MKGFESPTSPEALPFGAVVSVSLMEIVEGEERLLEDYGTGRIAWGMDPVESGRVVIVPDKPFPDNNQGPRSLPLGLFPHPQQPDVQLRYNFIVLPPNAPVA